MSHLAPTEALHKSMQLAVRQVARAPGLHVTILPTCQPPEGPKFLRAVLMTRPLLGCGARDSDITCVNPLTSERWMFKLATPGFWSLVER